MKYEKIFRRALFSLSLIASIFSFQIFAQVDDSDEINVDSTLVVLNAVVTDKNGKSVFGIKREEFKIFEDGIEIGEQAIDSFQLQETPYAAVVLMDTSGSMEQRVSLARSAAITFLDGLRSSDNVAIYDFNSKVSLVQDFSNTRDMFEKAFDIKAKGMTVLNDAVFKAATELEKRPEKRRAILILSDGADNSSKVSADKALKAALKANATIYTVDMSAIGIKLNEKAQNQGALKKFSEKTGGKFIETPGGFELTKAFKNIASELGSQYTFGYEPKDEKKDGKWHSLEVRISRPNLIIRTREGYHAEKTQVIK